MSKDVCQRFLTLLALNSCYTFKKQTRGLISLNKAIVKKVILILFVIFISVILILRIPEDSDLQLFLSFILGAMIYFTQPQATTKLEIYLKYFLILIFFIVWFFILSNKLQSVLFLIGAIFARNLMVDLHTLDF